MPSPDIIDNRPAGADHGAPWTGTPRIDVAIVGGGPAGAAAALRLAAAGAHVAIFDHSHPREKPCGGGVTARALELLHGACDLSSLPAVDIQALRFETGGESPAVVDLRRPTGSTTPPLIVTSRRAFDGMLLDAALAAGARLVPERVVDVDIRRDHVDLMTRTARYRAAVVVGADGANSLVRRRVCGPLGRARLSIAVGHYASGGSDATAAITFTDDPPGYAWSFPRPDHLAIGICAAAETGTSASVRVALGKWIAEAPGPAPQRYSWPIPTLGVADLDRPRWAGERWMLLGDAAGLVDPITREGIYFALRSGQLSADALGATRQRFGTYATMVHDEIRPELQRAARLRPRFFQPAFLKLLHHALATSPSIRAIMGDLIAGRQTYVGLGRRLALTLEVGLAWRLLRLPRSDSDA